MQAQSSPCEENIPPTAAHYPLGSRERHLIDEKLRALKESERQRRQQAAILRECTFHPRVGPSPHEHMSDSDRDDNRPIAFDAEDPPPEPHSVEGDSAINSSREREPVYDRLARCARERDARLAQLTAEKNRREEAALRNAFRPQLNSAPADPIARAATAAVPVEERLLHYGRAVAQSRRLQQAQQAQKELDAFRHARPQTQRGASGSDRHSAQQSGVADRSQRILQEREAERALAAEAQLRQHSFRPKLCAASRAMDAQQKRISTDRGAALYEAGVRRTLRRRETEAAQTAGDPHQPATNPLTDEWIHHGQHRALFEQNFVQRQEIYQRVRDEHRRGLAAALDERDGPPLAARVDQAMIDAQVRRLYHGEQEARRESQRRRGDAARERDGPFRPELAPATPYVVAHAGREPDFVKRLAARPPRRHPERSEEKDEEEEVSDARRVVRSDEAAAFYERQRAAAAQREAVRREQRQRAAMAELGACTFRPRTNTARGTGAVGEAPRVSGADAHVQRQAVAQRRRWEADAQLERLGRGLPCNGQSCTVVTPFHLSSGGARTRSAGRHVDPSNEATLRTRSRSAALW